MIYCYIRVSTTKQEYDRQVKILKDNGYIDGVNCQYIEETFTGKTTKRPIYEELTQKLEKDDTLIVESLPRLSRAGIVKTLEEISELVQKKKVNVVILKENFNLKAGEKPDANTNMLLGIFSVLAQFERDLISERTKETMAAISSSIAATSQNDSVQTLKNLMLLYLPWLPLQEGVGFDLEIEKNKEHIDSDSTIKIKITTVNYGNLQASVTLMSTNSVDVQIVCSEKFPKKHLLKKLNLDSRQHSMQANIDIQAQKPQLEQNVEKPKAKVNLSNVNEVNPYLLLICHAIIRHTIEIDTLTTLGQFSEDI